MAPNVLEGVRVVEVAVYGYVPAATAALSDWGAEVIKIEYPELREQAMTDDRILELKVDGVIT